MPGPTRVARSMATLRCAELPEPHGVGRRRACSASDTGRPLAEAVAIFADALYIAWFRLGRPPVHEVVYSFTHGIAGDTGA